MLDLPSCQRWSAKARAETFKRLSSNEPLSVSDGWGLLAALSAAIEAFLMADGAFPILPGLAVAAGTEADLGKPCDAAGDLFSPSPLFWRFAPALAFAADCTQVCHHSDQ